MSIEPSSIELEDFELVQATPGTVLLRVTARAPASIPREPTLLVDDGEHVHRVRPLPSPSDPDGWLRAAYSLRSEILDEMPAFMLEVWPGAFFDLPDPLERGRPMLRHRSQDDVAALIELEAAALEANRTAAALEAELEQALDRATEAEDRATEAEDALRLAEEEAREFAAERDRLREALRLLQEEAGTPDPAALEAADRAWDGVAASITSLRKQFDRDLGRLEEELRAARLQAAAAREGERAAKADAERMRADASEQDPETATELIREAADDRVQTDVEREIRAALAARSNPASGPA